MVLTMKRKILTISLSVLLSSFLVLPTFAQEEEESSVWSTGFDIYTSYIWRGSKFGSGPAFQPFVDATVGGLSIGAWGSVNSSLDEALEMDLYLSYGFGPVSLTVTDYYFGGDWTDMSMTHYIEPSVGVEAGGFSAMFAYMLLPGTEDDASTIGVDESTDFGEEGDTYLELGYGFDAVSFAVGLGNGAYTDDGDFSLCNITVGTSKEIAITEKFSLPVSGSVTLNPSTGGFFITAGVSF